MKKYLAAIIATLLVSALAVSLPASARTFKNCSELQKTYKYGVALTSKKAIQQGSNFQSPKISGAIYNRNKKLDIDKDGVVCEVKKSSSNAAPSVSEKPVAGLGCAVVGEVKKDFDRIYTCLSSSTGKRWSKGVLDKNFVYSTDDGYSHARSIYCDVDPDAGSEWTAFQSYIRNSVRACVGQLRLLSYKMGALKPKSELSALSSSVEPCKVANPARANWIKGFEDSFRRLKTNALGRNAVMQIIPIYAPDTAEPVNSPNTDYKQYFDFVRKYVEEVSDLPANFEIRVPEKYLKFSKPLKPYGVSHKLPQPHPSALREIISEVDSDIDFTGVTTALVLVPAGTAQDVWQQGPLGFIRTQEGEINGVSSQYPHSEKLLVPRPDFLNLSVPIWWVHEFYHVGVGLDDHYGFTQQNQTKVTGMGYWGLISPATTDLLGWEKWILDYIADSQVACVQPVAQPQNVWLRPSSVSTSEQKLAVVRLSASKAIVLESIRGAGLNHMLRPEEQGLMVYTVDAANNDHGFGFDLKYPATRPYVNGSFPGSLAPLKSGESVTVDGVLIKVIEAGNFGDVISIQSASN